MGRAEARGLVQWCGVLSWWGGGEADEADEVAKANPPR